MRKITDATGQEIVQGVPKVKGVAPVGTQIIVELLTPQEILGTQLHISNDVKTVNGAPQAYILQVGPKVDGEWGFKVGDRVVLSGSFVPLPEAVSANNRPVACVEPHVIKAVLLEN